MNIEDNTGVKIENIKYIREIWVDREESLLEYKLWFVFKVKFSSQTEKKIFSFLDSEKSRFSQKWSDNDAIYFQKAASEYADLSTNSTYMPPRLIDIGEEDLISMDTELIVDGNSFTFGDSVGGISPNKPQCHNEHLMEKINTVDRVLLNPGILARIEIGEGENKKYIFQLAEKNLRKKGMIFYKPIGGHLKYTEAFKPFINKLGLNLKNGNQEQDDCDLSLYVKPDKFFDLSDLLKQDLLSEKSFILIENPIISLRRELREEIGPDSASDGINLLNEQDLEEIYEEAIRN